MDQTKLRNAIVREFKSKYPKARVVPVERGRVPRHGDEYPVCFHARATGSEINQLAARLVQDASKNKEWVRNPRFIFYYDPDYNEEAKVAWVPVGTL